MPGNRVIGEGTEVALHIILLSVLWVDSFISVVFFLLTIRPSMTVASMQMYLGVYMICKGAVLFCIEEPLVIKRFTAR